MALSKRERAWFTKILGYSDQQVEEVRLDEAASEMHLFLAAPPGPYACPRCGRKHEGVHDRREKVMRDKPWADHTVFVHLSVLRVRCCQGLTPIELPLPEWAKKNSATLGDSVR
jgi:transposase